MWHTDLHGENILVDSEDHGKATGIIDWQATELIPLFCQIEQPHFLYHDGGRSYGLERLVHPEKGSRFDPVGYESDVKLWIDKNCGCSYRTMLHLQIPKAYRALELRRNPLFGLLIVARKLLTDGEATFTAAVAELEGEWPELPGVHARGNVPFPFQSSPAQRAEIEREHKNHQRGIDAMIAVRRGLGKLFPSKGTVSKEFYDESKKILRWVKREALADYAKNEEDKKLWGRALAIR